MANPLCEVLLTTSPLEVPATVVDLNAGGVADFWGIVRELEDGRSIEGIDYEAHLEMAQHQMNEIAQRAAADFDLQRVILRHRIGFVPVAEASLYVRVAAQHRQPAFRAIQWIVDELKKRVPIWKKPRFKYETSRQAASAAATTI